MIIEVWCMLDGDGVVLLTQEHLKLNSLLEFFLTTKELNKIKNLSEGWLVIINSQGIFSYFFHLPSAKVQTGKLS